MDVIFDIDGTLADASHRLHFIKDFAYFKPGGITRDLKPDWETFLSDEQVAQDTPIVPVWNTLVSLLADCHRVLFITGRPESQRQTTIDWMQRAHPMFKMRRQDGEIPIYMRTNGDRRSSSIVKQEGLMRARADGFDPIMVFEDRKGDTAMWRENGLLCCQVAEGNY